MRIKKPLFWNGKNLISLSLIPFSIITLIINFLKNFLFKKNYRIKTICVGNIYIGGTGKTSLSIEIHNILKKKFKTVFIKKKYSDQFDEQELNTWKTATIALGSALAALSLGMGATLCYCFCRKTSSQTPRNFELTSTSVMSSSAVQFPSTESESVPPTTQESV